MRKFALAAIVGLITAASRPAAAQTAASMIGKPIVLLDCSIRSYSDVRLPARMPGVLAELKVKEGAVVKKGQIIGKVDDELIRQDLEVYTLKAKNVYPVEQAVAEEEEMAARLGDEIKLKGYSPKEAKRLAEARLEIAKAKVNDTRVQAEVAKAEQRKKEKELELHQLVSPFDGEVVEVFRQEKEALQALEPVVRIARKDKVKVHGLLALRDKERVRKGMPLEVFPSQPGREIWALHGHTDAVHCVRATLDGRGVLSGGADGAIILWDLEQGRQKRVFFGHEGAVNAVVIDPSDPNRFISAGADHTIRIWDVNNNAPVKTRKLSAGVVLCAVLHPQDPQRLLTGHEDRQIRIWNLSNDENPIVLAGHTNHVTSLAATKDGKFLLSTGGDQTDRVWDLEAGKEILPPFSGRSVTSSSQIGLSPDGKFFLFDSYALLQVRTLSDFQPVASFDIRAGSGSGIAVFSPVPGLILSAADNGQLQLWLAAEQATGHSRLVRTFDGHTGGVRSVDFTPDGSLLATGGADRAVRIWGVPTIQAIQKERKVGIVESVSSQAETGSLTLVLIAEVENKDETLTPGALATIVINPERGQPTAKVGD